jgi:hypothetical protein
MWYTWLAYFGFIFGILVTATFGISLGRSSVIGLVTGLVLVTLWNVADPTPTPCLQEAKGWDILRAYSFCGK